MTDITSISKSVKEKKIHSYTAGGESEKLHTLQLLKIHTQQTPTALTVYTETTRACPQQHCPQQLKLEATTCTTTDEPVQCGTTTQQNTIRQKGKEALTPAKNFHEP